MSKRRWSGPIPVVGSSSGTEDAAPDGGWGSLSRRCGGGAAGGSANGSSQPRAGSEPGLSAAGAGAGGGGSQLGPGWGVTPPPKDSGPRLDSGEGVQLGTGPGPAPWPRGSGPRLATGEGVQLGRATAAGAPRPLREPGEPAAGSGGSWGRSSSSPPSPWGSSSWPPSRAAGEAPLQPRCSGCSSSSSGSDGPRSAKLGRSSSSVELVKLGGGGGGSSTAAPPMGSSRESVPSAESERTGPGMPQAGVSPAKAASPVPGAGASAAGARSTGSALRACSEASLGTGAAATPMVLRFRGSDSNSARASGSGAPEAWTSPRSLNGSKVFGALASGNSEGSGRTGRGTSEGASRPSAVAPEGVSSVDGGGKFHAGAAGGVPSPESSTSKSSELARPPGVAAANGRSVGGGDPRGASGLAWSTGKVRVGVASRSELPGGPNWANGSTLWAVGSTGLGGFSGCTRKV
jgi:hypothetical protein